MASSRLRSLPSARRICKLVAVAGDGNAGRVIAAVFQPPQALNDDRNNLLLTDIANNATHAGTPEIQSAREQRNSSMTGLVSTSRAMRSTSALRFFAAQPAIERELEILSLANFFQAFVAHLLERTVDGFALGIENTFLERNVNVGFHGGLNYTSASDGRLIAEFVSSSAPDRPALVPAWRGDEGRGSARVVELRSAAKGEGYLIRAAGPLLPAVRRGFWDAVFPAASSCCASTDLLSQPRAMSAIIRWTLAGLTKRTRSCRRGSHLGKLLFRKANM